MRRGARGEAGLTLIEVLVASAISLVVIGAAMSALGAFGNAAGLRTRQSDASDRARAALGRMAKELRNVQAAATGIERAEPFDIVFQIADPSAAPAPGGRGLERVRYCLSGSTLYRQTEPPGGTLAAAACPAPGWTTQTELASGAQPGGQALFTYGNATLPSASTELGLALTIDADPGRPPAPVTLQTSVALRDNHGAPVAQFTWLSSHGGNTLVHLDGTASRTPTGQPPTYAWYLDGYPGGTQCGTGATLDCDVGTTTGRPVTLVVTDLDGLTDQTTRTVHP